MGLPKQVHYIFIISALIAQAALIEAEIVNLEIDATENAPEIFEDIIKPFNDTGALKVHPNWRVGLKFNDALIHMFNESKLTDCEFIVGRNGSEETIRAHSVILAAASPVFEHAFENFTTFRISSWQPSEFRKVLNFIYSGGLCFENFDEACTLLKLSSDLLLSDAKEAAHSYIYSNMYPDRLWQAYQCAKEAGEDQLANTAMGFIADFTSSAIKDPKFSDITQNDLEEFLKRDDLAVESEIELFDAVIRWGYRQVIKSGQKPTPQLIREKLGPEIIKNIRFLTMTAQEYSKIYVSSFILDYQESLAVLLNINSPGGLEIPATLSSNTNKRGRGSFSEKIEGDYFVVGPNAWPKFPPFCGYDSSSNFSYVDNLTSLYIHNIIEWRIHAIQIPKSLEARSNSSVQENLIVKLINSQGTLIASKIYNRIPPAVTTRGVFSAGSATPTMVDDDKLITISFDDLFAIPKLSEMHGPYKIKIEFLAARRFPKWISSGHHMSSTSYSVYRNVIDSYDGQYDNVRVVPGQSFVYSILTT